MASLSFLYRSSSNTEISSPDEGSTASSGGCGGAEQQESCALQLPSCLRATPSLLQAQEKLAKHTGKAYSGGNMDDLSVIIIMTQVRKDTVAAPLCAVFKLGWLFWLLLLRMICVAMPCLACCRWFLQAINDGSGRIWSASSNSSAHDLQTAVRTFQWVSCGERFQQGNADSATQRSYRTAVAAQAREKLV